MASIVVAWLDDMMAFSTVFELAHLMDEEQAGNLAPEAVGCLENW